VWLNSTAVPFRDENDTIVAALAITRNVTELKQTMEELQKKNADMEQFIYTVSHDLHTPLVTVKNFLGFLENDLHGDNQKLISQDFQFIHGAADKMKLLLDELLELARSDRVETLSARVSLKNLVAVVLDDMAGVIKKGAVKIDLTDTELMLFGDRPRLSQIWQNLIENAIKYGREGCFPHIEIGVQPLNGETVFFVKDDGIGIDPQYQHKVFDIFEKLDPKSPGAGMGLSMIRRIVEKLGGRIWVESEGRDKGSCFFFTLPQAVIDV
jgi:signal transduction histidine kinase